MYPVPIANLEKSMVVDAGAPQDASSPPKKVENRMPSICSEFTVLNLSPVALKTCCPSSHTVTDPSDAAGLFRRHSCSMEYHRPGAKVQDPRPSEVPYPVVEGMSR